jgi:hypothetical protein
MKTKTFAPESTDILAPIPDGLRLPDEAKDEMANKLNIAAAAYVGGVLTNAEFRKNFDSTLEEIYLELYEWYSAKAYENVCYTKDEVFMAIYHEWRMVIGRLKMMSSYALPFIEVCSFKEYTFHLNRQEAIKYFGKYYTYRNIVNRMKCAVYK